jgi:hypothetical protein
MNAEKEREETMDPDVTLKQIRKEAERIMLVADLTNPSVKKDYMEAAESLAENFINLDSWLSQQGFLPKAWFFPKDDEVERDGE